jgi:hypothetical protein
MQSACTACFLVASFVIDQAVGSLNGTVNPPCRLQKEPLHFSRTKPGRREEARSWGVPMGLAAPVKIRYIVVGNTEKLS